MKNHPHITSYAAVASVLLLCVAWTLGGITLTQFLKGTALSFAVYALVLLGYGLRDTLLAHRRQRELEAVEKRLRALREKLPPPNYTVVVADGAIAAGDLVIVENGKARRVERLAATPGEPVQ